MNKFEIGDEVIITDMSNYVIQECLGKVGRIVGITICGKCYTVYCDGALLRLKENQIEEKGMSEFIVGDVIKNPITNGFAKVLFVSENNTLIRYIEDGDKGYKHKGSEVLIIKHDLQNFRLANDEWIAYQEQQKVKEESKAIATILKELVSQIENGELHVFTREFDYSKTRVVGGDAISLKFEGISK